MLNHIPTGRSFHVYVNPERDMPPEAFAVHGLSTAFLSDKPVFAAIAGEFLEFVGDARLVAHNASFDVAFFDAELRRLGYPPLAPERIVDTLQIARRKFPFANNSLDGLCQRFGIDNSRRTKHGALLDAEILAEVYLELMGGRQASFGLADTRRAASPAGLGAARRSLARPQPLPPRLTADEQAAHRAFVATLGPEPVWNDYWAEGEAEAAS
jgi:DNA polymerase-3 subunit epsilon